MSYQTMQLMAKDPGLRDRIHACCNEQGVSFNSLVNADGLWTLAASPGWAAAWDSALANSAITDKTTIGTLATVVSDAMLLSAIQPLKTKYPAS